SFGCCRFLVAALLQKEKSTADSGDNEKDHQTSHAFFAACAEPESLPQTSANGNYQDEFEAAAIDCAMRDFPHALSVRSKLSGSRAGQSHAPRQLVRHYSWQTIRCRSAPANGSGLAHILEIFRRRRPSD